MTSWLEEDTIAECTQNPVARRMVALWRLGQRSLIMKCVDWCINGADNRNKGPAGHMWVMRLL